MSFHKHFCQLSLPRKTTKMAICDVCYMNPNLSLLGSRWSQHALLIGFDAWQPKEILLAELRQYQHFYVVILDGVGGYKVDTTGISILDVESNISIGPTIFLSEINVYNISVSKKLIICIHLHSENNIQIVEKVVLIEIIRLFENSVCHN